MSFVPNSTEVDYLRKNFMETLKLYGVQAKYHPITSSTETAYDLYDDVQVESTGTYGEPLDVFVTFEEVPNIKTLKALGWYIKSDENLPMLAHVPLTYEGSPVKVKKDDIIEIVGNDYVKSRKFLIKDFRGHGFPNVVYWVCKLVNLDVNKDA